MHGAGDRLSLLASMHELVSLRGSPCPKMDHVVTETRLKAPAQAPLLKSDERRGSSLVLRLFSASRSAPCGCSASCRQLQFNNLSGPIPPTLWRPTLDTL